MPLRARRFQRFLHVVDLEGLDDRGDELHRRSDSRTVTRAQNGSVPQAICGKTTWGLPLTMGAVGCDVAQCSGRPPKAAGRDLLYACPTAVYSQRRVEKLAEQSHEYTLVAVSLPRSVNS